VKLIDTTQRRTKKYSKHSEKKKLRLENLKSRSVGGDKEHGGGRRERRWQCLMKGFGFAVSLWQQTT